MSQITKHFNRTLLGSVLLLAVSQFNYGFDNQAFATTQATNAFTKQFGDFDPKTQTYVLQTYWLSLFNSVVYVGFAVGLVVGSLISQRYGRRMAMFLMCIYAWVSATVVITSQTPGQIMAGRILNYVYIGMELATVPMYQSEIVPAPVRGLVVSTYQLMIATGGLVINGIVRATGSLPDRRAYMIPYGLFYIVPTIVAAFIWFIPESPRWLMSRNRMDDARVAHRKYRAGTMSDDAIEAEFDKLREALEKEPEQGRTVELFQGVNLKRTLIILGLNFFLQATGQAFISQYGAIFIRSLGTVNPFSITLGNTGVNVFFVLVALLLADKVGRRPLILLSCAVMAVGLFVMGGLGLENPVSYSHKSGEIAMLMITAAGFAVGLAPLNYVVTTELPALRLRDRSQRVASMMNIFMNFLVTFIIPYLLNPPYANLGGRVGFIFGAISILAVVFVYFCVPECKGRSLEEIDLMFHEGVPIRQFGSHPKLQIEVDAAGGRESARSMEEAPEKVDESPVTKE